MREPQANADRDRLTDLCLRRSGSGLTREEVAELDHLLGESAEARREYWRLALIHSELDWELGAGVASHEAAGAQQKSTTHSRRSPPALRTSVGVLAWAALAACLLLTVTLARTGWWSNTARTARVDSGDTAHAESLGVIKPLGSSSVWSFGRSGADNTSAVFPGDTISLSEGAFELHLASETVATLEAPALVQTVSQDRFRLLSGHIKVEVAEGDEGFTVETASAEVVDLGTVFSVSFDEGDTDLVVFDGAVDLKVANDREDPIDSVRRFRAGEAVQVQKNGTLSRIVQVRQSSVASDAGDDASPLTISSMRDDSTRENFWRFYEIIPGGMQEDAAAFVDRPHQWNGRRGRSLPTYLVGGDYVKTFNDDKVTRELKIEIALSRPADLYVLLDTRVSPPGWLLADFEDTGDRIGLDEAHAATAGRSQRLASGPGVSIDRLHSVWKRSFPEGGLVSLGPNGDLTDDSGIGVEASANMYGVVAVPITNESTLHAVP